ncbi:MAG: hypothetical protein DRJ38_08630 [Thermoprotei archaeon]|nr:MAG: hypothetical protein DRJ38_08630 [Thermoprotei archaeon]
MKLLETSIGEAIEALRRLGLSRYEALTYLHLLISGGVSPKAVCDATGIPYTKVYDVLKRLERKGWIIQISDRPVLYVAKSPSEVIKKIEETFKHRISEARRLLSELEKFRTEGASVASILVVRSFEALASMIKDFFRKAEIEIRTIVATSYINELINSLVTSMSLKVRILLRPGMKPPSRGDYRYIVGGILPLDLIIADTSRMILSLGRMATTSHPRVFGVVISDEELISAAVEYFDTIWEQSSIEKN